MNASLGNIFFDVPVFCLCLPEGYLEDICNLIF